MNLTVVEESIHSLRLGHLPLALAANGLARREEDLKSYVDDGLPQETTAYGANARLRTARSPRDSAFKGVIHAVDSYKDLGIPLPSLIADTIADLTKVLDGLKGPYDLVVCADVLHYVRATEARAGLATIGAMASDGSRRTRSTSRQSCKRS